MPEDRVIESFFDADEIISDLEMPEKKFRSRRTRNRSVLEKAIKPSHLQNLVNRKRLFTSVGHPSFNSSGLVSIADNNSLTINNTITDSQGRLWLMVPEQSWYINAVADSNEYPNGSFFGDTDATTTENNYDVFSVIKYGTSTDSVIKWSAKMINRTGASVNMGVILGMRFIINSATAPTT